MPQDPPAAPGPEEGAVAGSEECKGEVAEPERPAAASEDPYQPQPVPPTPAAPLATPKAEEPEGELGVGDEGGAGEAAEGGE
eukprot:9457871-Alexandrium_andersonii.AAC.1